MPSNNSEKTILLLSILVLADLTLLCIHLFFVFHNLNSDTFALQAYHHPLLSILNAFDLDGEGTVPAWFSSAKLLTISFLAFIIFQHKNLASKTLVADATNKTKHWLWLFVAIVFLMLSADESASLHERTAGALTQLPWLNSIKTSLLAGDSLKSSFAWVLLFSPIIILIFYFLLKAFISEMYQNKITLWLGCLGVACFGLAILLEASVYLAPPVSDWYTTGFIKWYKLSTSVEELFELLGTSLILSALASLALFVPQRKSACL